MIFKCSIQIWQYAIIVDLLLEECIQFTVVCLLVMNNFIIYLIFIVIISLRGGLERLSCGVDFQTKSILGVANTANNDKRRLKKFRCHYVWKSAFLHRYLTRIWRMYLFPLVWWKAVLLCLLACVVKELNCPLNLKSISEPCLKTKTLNASSTLKETLSEISIFQVLFSVYWIQSQQWLVWMLMCPHMLSSLQPCCRLSSLPPVTSLLSFLFTQHQNSPLTSYFQLHFVICSCSNIFFPPFTPFPCSDSQVTLRVRMLTQEASPVRCLCHSLLSPPQFFFPSASSVRNPTSEGISPFFLSSLFFFCDICKDLLCSHPSCSIK